jgi:heterodisulfide reductase subunit C
MDTLRQMSRREGIKTGQKNSPIFHEAFLASVRRHGRVHEPEMALDFTLRSAGWRGLLRQAGTGLAMFTRGKIKLLPPRTRGKGQVRNIFRKVRMKGRT